MVFLFFSNNFGMAALAGKMKVNGPGVFFLIALNTAFEIGERKKDA